MLYHPSFPLFACAFLLSYKSSVLACMDLPHIKYLACKRQQWRKQHTLAKEYTSRTTKLIPPIKQRLPMQIQIYKVDCHSQGTKLLRAINLSQ